MIIWRFIDGKPGHENQTNGLIAALSRSLDVTVFDIPVNSLSSSPILLLQAFFRIKIKKFPTQQPNLIIGAGSKTHIPMVVATSQHGGKSIVLMRPTIPMRLFDLVVAPLHDAIPHRSNMLETNGVLNAVQFLESKDQHQGLILIGGDSSHYKWSSKSIASQIIEVVSSDRNTNWVLSTSRRTPEQFVKLVNDNINFSNLTFVPFEQTDQQWMQDHFAKSGQIWVSPDSVSMVYESLSSGAATYVFALEPKHSKKSRIIAGLELLIRDGAIITFDQWKDDPSIQHSPCVFNEASRVSEYLLEHVL